jgi:cytochrome P450
MTHPEVLDRARIRELFDLRSQSNSMSGGGYTEDPYPTFHRLRETGAVHLGTVHEMLEWEGEAIFQGLPQADRPHYTAFSYEACERAFRDNETFASSPSALDLSGVSIDNSMLAMGGSEHRRYRSLVQPSFVPSKAKWWIENWIENTVSGLIDQLEGESHAELNVDFCAAIPVLTIPAASASLFLGRSISGKLCGATAGLLTPSSRWSRRSWLIADNNLKTISSASW